MPEHIAMRLICSEARVIANGFGLKFRTRRWEKLVNATGQMPEAPLLIGDAMNHSRLCT